MGSLACPRATPRAPLQLALAVVLGITMLASVQTSLEHMPSADTSNEDPQPFMGPKGYGNRSQLTSPEVVVAEPSRGVEDAWDSFDLGWPPEDEGEAAGNADLMSEDEFLHADIRMIDRLDQAPEKFVLVRSKINTRIEKPRSPDNRRIEHWFSQFETAFILRVDHAFIGDNAIFGPSLKSSKDKSYFSLSRWWNGYPKAYMGSSKGIEHKDLKYAVAVGGWGASAFQHFVIDVLPKLALVYPMLVSERAKRLNVTLITTLGRNPAPYWFLEQLGLADRTLPMMGWPKKAKFIYRGYSVLYPDYDPPPVIFNKARIGIYPRGVMLPIQKALGVMKETRRDRIVLLYRHGGRRSLASHVRRELSKAIESRVAAFNSAHGHSIEISVFKFTTREEMRALFSRALMIIGPHGGGFSNMVFSRPGTFVVEFLPLHTFSMKNMTSRTSQFCYYGLTQACGHHYWFVNPENFDFNRGGMVVDIQLVLHIVGLALTLPLPE
mmetsp:Transcript_12523/g.30827  ORF Transcript_12523/g.30827 Transcript_12523/m.30827 type:complete len:494 (-) Transcript_12523:109-1590(-)